MKSSDILPSHGIYIIQKGGESIFHALIKVPKLVFGKLSDSMAVLSKGLSSSLLLSTRKGYIFQFSSPQMWKGGVGSGTWIVLASRVCPEVTTVTSGWKPWMPVETSPALWGLQKHACSVISVRLFATPWTAAHRAPLSMGFSRQEY